MPKELAQRVISAMVVVPILICACNARRSFVYNFSLVLNLVDEVDAESMKYQTTKHKFRKCSLRTYLDVLSFLCDLAGHPVDCLRCILFGAS